ncbi:MAG TPA: Ig-like domain-containing protein, partial [Candidatus Deferrimicrobium sp.]|nr:Ig-like domain-containing protein [Candidatus Deferrimicrobium sp.]
MSAKRKSNWQIFIILNLIVMIFFVYIPKNINATVTPGITVDLTTEGQYIDIGSQPIAIMGFSATVTSLGDYLVSVEVGFSGNGFSTSDLRSLNTDSAISGVGIYRDDGLSDDALDAADTPIILDSIFWVGNTVQISLTELVPLSVNGIYWLIVIRTSGTISNGDTLNATLAQNAIVYSDASSQPISSSLMTHQLIVDTEPPSATFTGFTEITNQKYLYHVGDTIYYSQSNFTEFRVSINASDTVELDKAVGLDKFTSMALYPVNETEGIPPNVYSLLYQTNVTDAESGIFTIRVYDKRGLYVNITFSVVCDNVSPDKPLNLVVTPASWTMINLFNLTWDNPSDVSGIAGVWYKIGTPPTNNSDGIYHAGANITSLNGITVPGLGSHMIYIWLQDNVSNIDFNNFTSAILRYGEEIPTPSVEILTPKNGNQYMEYDRVPVIVNVTDVKTITKVELYSNTTYIADLQNNSTYYIYDWENTMGFAGINYLYIKAYNDIGQVNDTEFVWINITLYIPPEDHADLYEVDTYNSTGQ